MDNILLYIIVLYYFIEFKIGECAAVYFDEPSYDSIIIIESPTTVPTS